MLINSVKKIFLPHSTM